MPELFDPQLIKAFKADKKWLETTKIPIVTVFGTNREDIKGWHGMKENENLPDVVLSRAHFSMAFGTAVQAWGGGIDHHKAWLVDPTNYVSSKHWQSLLLTENIGKTIARYPILKTLKDLIDKFGRQKLPILDSITPPLLYLTAKIKKPILSFHIAAGNLLIEQGKTVLQVITDPHVRYDYLKHVEDKNLSYCVFDQATKDDLLEKAAIAGKSIDPARIIVTGPPIDPRILDCRLKKPAWRSGTLKLCLTTGGLGTNKTELLQILDLLLPELRKKNKDLQLLIYAGTHRDIAQAVKKMAKESRVTLSPLKKTKAKLRLIYHPQIVDANELLIKYGFAWAHGFITKPSGDMAYDAVASGSFLLTLHEWGEWEAVIRQRFEELGVSRRATVNNLLAQLTSLKANQHNTSSFIERAMLNSHKLDTLYLRGAEKIIKAYQKIA